MKYYIIITEWNYPTESGRDIIDTTFDTRQEAEEEARIRLMYEDDNYYNIMGFSACFTSHIEDGVIKYVALTPPLEDCNFYFLIRIVEIEAIKL